MAKSNYAYVIPYDDYYAPALLYYLQDHGLVVKVSSKPCTIKINGKDQSFHRGALLVPVEDPFELDKDAVYKWVKEGSEK